MAQKQRFAYSLNGDRFVGSFAGRAEALEAGIAHARQSPDSPMVVYVGRLIPTLPATRGHARDLLRRMRQRAEAENREAAHQYLDGVTAEQVAELDERLSQAIHEWLRRHGPRELFDVEAISEHPVPMPPEAPSPPIDEVTEIGESGYPAE